MYPTFYKTDDFLFYFTFILIHFLKLEPASEQNLFSDQWLTCSAEAISVRLNQRRRPGPVTQAVYVNIYRPSQHLSTPWANRGAEWWTLTRLPPPLQSRLLLRKHPDWLPVGERIAAGSTSVSTSGPDYSQTQAHQGKADGSFSFKLSLYPTSCSVYIFSSV